MENKKGIFGLIILESVKKFYDILREKRKSGKTVEAASNKWVFRFVSHPEYGKGDISYIGKLLPGAMQAREQNLRVTFIPRQTGMAETLDVNPEIMEGFTYYSDGYYEVAYQEKLEIEDTAIQSINNAALARFEAFIPDKAFAGKKIEFIVQEDDIMVTGKDDPAEGNNIFRIPSDWVNSPHLRIRYNQPDSKFYLASFGEKTVVNESEVKPSTVADPMWVELPLNSKMVLNGIIGINIFKS
jgi:hypothetical protein